MSKKINTYICSGCEIGNCLDISSLETIANENPLVNRTYTHHSLCSEHAIQEIIDNTREDEADGILIAACSSRNKTKEFGFDLDAVVERVD